MVSGAVGVPGGTPKPPRITPQGEDYPSNYLSATTDLSWKSVLGMLVLVGAVVLIILLVV